ncbi:RNI-like protein [Echria macrotheca]|uniref:RNI-like protein n=1 Tax=Echria macrotheca TaxID=438768 RepID=A0AAJ0FCD7_9PEZI|nr:RNI-like protein [Echria macrotheca]
MMKDEGLEGRGWLAPLKTVDSSVSDVVESPTSTIASSPTGTDSGRRFSLHSLTNKARRSISGRESVVSASDAQRRTSHLRRLSKSRPQSTPCIMPLTSRDSSVSDDSGHLSISETSSPLPLSSSIDWKSQKVEGFAPLEPDTQFLRTRTPFLVVTSEYLVKLKCRKDALCLFPSLSDTPAPDVPAPNPDPLLVIPLSAVISVFPAESTRPSFGIEVWWKAAPGVSFQQASFFFGLPRERDEQMYYVTRAMRATQNDESDAAQPPPEVYKLLSSICETTEPDFKTRRMEVFPVVPRASTRREYVKKAEDNSKKSHHGTPSFYLVVGTYLCHFVVIQKSKAGELSSEHKSFGLVTLEEFRGNWDVHEERFNLAFRHPFSSCVVLELASRFYRRLIRVLGTADRYLQPNWPLRRQTAEIFRVRGLGEPQYLVPREDFGSVRRTLDAYAAAYRCRPVEWEINWKGLYSPEFRVLPAKDGSRYSPQQLLAVLRALRYNDYFHSLSFRDVDLSSLHNVYDTFATTKSPMAYMSRTGVIPSTADIEILQQSSVLHQEFHALAFCSEAVYQIDVSRSPTPRGKKEPPSTLQFLTPILALLRSGITRCHNLVLSGNPIGHSDLVDIVETLEAGKILGLDISSCGLFENDLKSLVAAFQGRFHPLRSLNISGNPGRLPARLLPDMLYSLVELRELNLRGSLQADSDISEPLIPYEILVQLECLEDLDLAGFKLNIETIEDLCAFLHHRANYPGDGGVCRLRRLVLDHCGITGGQVAELCRSIGYDSGMLLSVSGNLLEDGIDYLADAISGDLAPAGLLMEQVEFKDEDNYVRLIRALARNRSISLLSLAGTAPTPFPDAISQPCSDDVIATLEDFFAHNQTVQFLDLSGFSCKLEDGQLAKGFARSLAGLTKNTGMTHLRIRSQNLHDDVGVLGQMLKENRTLRVLDCQENQFNLSSVKFLVSSVKANDTLICLPFSVAEQVAIWNNIQQSLRKTSDTGKEGAANRLTMQEAMLRQVLNEQFHELENHMRRNREALEATTGITVEFDASVDTLEDMERAWMTMMPMWPTAETASGPTWRDEESTPTTATMNRPTLRSSQAYPEAMLAPYHVRNSDDGAVSPADTLDPASEISTPPDGGSGGDLVFDKAVRELQRALSSEV